jgi:hypothetical protein
MLKYDERVQQVFGEAGYQLDDKNRIRPKKETKTVPFADLMDVLRSDDEKLLEENAWMFDEKECKFLDMNNEKTATSEGNKVIYASFPRSGQSFCRTYLQKIVGIATGCDVYLEYTLDAQFFNFKGMEITDDSVWLCRTHWPLALPSSIIQYGHK